MLLVKTKEELKDAIKNREPEILITDKALATEVEKAKTIRKWSKGALIASLTVLGLGAGGVAVLGAATLFPVMAVAAGTGVGTAGAVAGGSFWGQMSNCAETYAKPKNCSR